MSVNNFAEMKVKVKMRPCAVRQLSCIVLLPAVFFVCAVMSCQKISPDSRLLQINNIADTDPMRAISLLDSISRDKLSIPDRHFYDLMSIKADDKAYIKHTSDSLIRDVIDWYTGHKEDSFYAEALYYGGRVYADLGDCPTALKFFQKALDALHNSDNLDLEIRVLSQTGRLLNNMCLYDEAIPYLEQCVNVGASIDDSVVSPYDMQLLGSVYMHKGDYKCADKCFRVAYEKSLQADELTRAAMQGFIGANKFYMGDMDSALILIRGIPESVEKGSKLYFSSFAAQIYLEHGKLDSAYMYALDVAKGDHPRFRTIGYSLLLRPELIHLSPSDSVPRYLAQYHRALVERDHESENNAVMIQNSLYNYSLHEREAAESAQDKNRLMAFLLVVSVIVLALLAGVFFLRYVNNQKQVKLQQALLNIRELNSQLRIRGESMTRMPAMLEGDNNGLREKLLDEISLLVNNDKHVSRPEPVQSDGLALVEQCLKDGSILTDADDRWEQIRLSIRSFAPNFEMYMRCLSSTALSQQEMRVAMLIRLGLPSNRIADLLGRTKGAITYNRKQLCAKMCAGQINLQNLDCVISSLW